MTYGSQGVSEGRPTMGVGRCFLLLLLRNLTVLR